MAKKPKPVVSTRIKVEPGSFKVESGIINPEPTSPEPSEAWRVKYAVLPVYRS